jgi:hypothetical protein
LLGDWKLALGAPLGVLLFVICNLWVGFFTAATTFAYFHITAADGAGKIKHPFLPILNPSFLGVWAPRFMAENFINH